MKTHLKLSTFRKKLCPSGAWDNGLYVVGDTHMLFPKALLATAVFNIVPVKALRYKDGQLVVGTAPREAVQITVGDSHWLVEKDKAMDKLLLDMACTE